MDLIETEVKHAFINTVGLVYLTLWAKLGRGVKFIPNGGYRVQKGNISGGEFHFGKFWIVAGFRCKQAEE